MIYIRCIVLAGGPDYGIVTRNLALELVRVTEAAALGGAAWLGKGDKNAADQVQPRATDGCNRVDLFLPLLDDVRASAIPRGTFRPCRGCPSLCCCVPLF